LTKERDSNTTSRILLPRALVSNNYYIPKYGTYVDGGVVSCPALPSHSTLPLLEYLISYLSWLSVYKKYIHDVHISDLLGVSAPCALLSLESLVLLFTLPSPRLILELPLGF